MIADKVPQIQRYAEITNNFTNMNALAPPQKHYLNYCIKTYYEAVPIQQSLGSKSFIFDIIGHGKGEIIGWDLVHIQAGDLKIPKQPSGKIKDRPGGLHIYTEESQEYLERIYTITKEKDPIKGARSIKFSSLIPGRYGHSWTFPKDCNLKQSVKLVEEAFKNKIGKNISYEDSIVQIPGISNNGLPILIRAKEIGESNGIKNFITDSFFPCLEERYHDLFQK